MSPTTHDWPRSAAESCYRIDFTPSLRAGAAWLTWLATAIAMTWVADLALGWQLAISTAVGVTGVLTVRRCVLLRGRRAIRALEWLPSDGGGFEVILGTPGRRMAAVPDECRRYGPSLWLLRFRTREGLVESLVDAGYQDPRALRRLARRLFPASVR